MLSVRGWMLPDCRLCKITDISVDHEQLKRMELIYIPCKFLSNYFTSISSYFIYLVSNKDLIKSHALADIGIVMLPAYLWKNQQWLQTEQHQH